jgi:hypothetical protein
VSCHEAQALRPVLQSPQAWHADHAFGDLCVACHGGDPRAASKPRAHVGVRQPLLQVAQACGSCHADAGPRSERYWSLLRASRPAAPRQAAGSSGVADGVLMLVAAVLGVALIAAYRPRRGASRGIELRPYRAGVLLGLVVACSEVFAGRPLGVAGAFDRLAAYLGVRLFPNSQYYCQIMTPGITWQVWVVFGLGCGAWLAALASGQARVRWLPDSQWRERFGAARARRLGVAFAGAFLVQFGAGIAGGCTSGLAISGGAALAPAAFIFMAGMFASGIPTAWLWYRKRAP